MTSNEVCLRVPVMKLNHHGIAALSILGFSLQPLAAGAQAPSYATHGETIHGAIASVENVNHIFVADDVTLRPGASIFSNGIRLAPGERVTIVGTAAGPTFLATRIATEGRRSGAVAAVAPYDPAPAYYPEPVYYPAYYGYGYPYGYGLSIGFGFGFHDGFGPYHGGGYHGFVGGAPHGGHFR